MAARRHRLRSYLIARIRRGEFASVREIMIVGDLPRQTVNRWLREERIKLASCRLQRLAVDRTQALQYVERMSGHRMTGKQARRETLQAVRRFNAANAADQGES